MDLRKLRSWVDSANVYRHQIPKVDDHVWMMPEFVMHGIPLILFDYGLRLPLYPFHLAMFEAIDVALLSLCQMPSQKLVDLLCFVAKRIKFLLFGYFSQFMGSDIKMGKFTLTLGVSDQKLSVSVPRIPGIIPNGCIFMGGIWNLCGLGKWPRRLLTI